jgi:hypothetical protein
MELRVPNMLTECEVLLQIPFVWNEMTVWLPELYSTPSNSKPHDILSPLEVFVVR